MPAPVTRGATVYMGGAVVGFNEASAVAPSTGGIPDVSILPEPFTTNQTPGQAATGAVAGKPGYWTAAGGGIAAAPLNLAACPALTGKPTWTVGQYALLRDTTSKVYWNGTAWVAGAAP